MRKVVAAVLFFFVFASFSHVSAAVNTHTVKKGDTLWSISQKNKVSVSNIMKYNGLSLTLIHVGQVLKLSPDAKKPVEKEKVNVTSKIHTVKKGDTLWAISKKYNVSVSNIMKWNKMNNTIIRIGQKLHVENGERLPIPTTPPVKTPSTNDIVYTVVKGDTLYKISRTYQVSVANIMSWNKLKNSTIHIGQKLIIKQTSKKPEPSIPTPNNGDAVKGIYMSGNSAGLDSKFNSLVSLINRTELNAVVIDVKGDGGNITYDSNVVFANQLKTDANPLIKNINQRMNVLKKHDIYTIARIVTFKDQKVATQRKDLAMKKKDGTLYYDSGVPWVDPYKKEYWEYVVDIAKEAAEKGFDEIQFDYVRFPTNGKYVDQVVKFDNPQKISKAQNIQNFLRYAVKELEPYNVKVSADIFGIATSDRTDSGIGHHWETLTQSGIDVMSPMLYPSHYAKGSYGISNPDANPYLTIKKGLGYAVERDKVLESKGISTAEIRPWFQDFTDKRYAGYTIYGTKQVKDQIRAAKEYGINGYLLWNPQNVYTEGAVK